MERSKSHHVITIFAAILCGVVIVAGGCSMGTKMEDNYYNQYTTSSEYADCINVPNFLCTVDAVIEVYGEPDAYFEFVTSGGMPAFEVRYTGICFTFVALRQEDETSSYRLVRATITSVAYAFGSCQIKVGSGKKEVEAAYMNNPTAYEKVEEGAGYIDGEGLYVRFLYDKNDVVTKITITFE